MKLFDQKETKFNYNKKNLKSFQYLKEAFFFFCDFKNRIKKCKQKIKQRLTMPE